MTVVMDRERRPEAAEGIRLLATGEQRVAPRHEEDRDELGEPQVVLGRIQTKLAVISDHSIPKLLSTIDHAESERQLDTVVLALSEVSRSIVGLGSRVDTARERAQLESLFAGVRAVTKERREPKLLRASILSDLEAATGRSLGHVRVHDGVTAAAIATHHGSRAVARGADIYLRKQVDPTSLDDRELIAHEVAHVLQADPSALRPAKSAQPTDAEQEADAFASEFRARGRAMSWAPTVSISSGAVMNAPQTAPKPIDRTKSDVAWAYLRANEPEFLASIQQRLASAALVPSTKFFWVPAGLSSQFPTALAGALGTEPLFLRLPELMYPLDPWFVIDLNRNLTEGLAGVIDRGKEPIGPLFWNPQSGDALAIEMLNATRESLSRMVPRFEAQLEIKNPERVAVADLVTSHPLDRVIARLLCDQQVVVPIKQKKGTKRSAPAQRGEFREGTRFIQGWHWLGETNRTLWNWIEVTDPKDATAEDVAATLWLDADQSFRAYGITGTAPYFRVDPGWAMLMPGAKDLAPSKFDPAHSDNSLALAESPIATEAAIGQAAGEREVDRAGKSVPQDRRYLAEILEVSQRQLERAKDLLLPWRLSELVYPALNWVISYSEHIDAIPDTRLVDLGPVIKGQHAILFEAIGALQEVADIGRQAVGADGVDGPVTGTLRSYATAAGESHLIGAGRTELERARRLKSSMTLGALALALRSNQEALRDYKASSETPGAVADEERGLRGREARLVEMRARQAAGKPLEIDDVELLAAETREGTFVSKFYALLNEVSHLRNAARDASFGFWETVATSKGYRRVPELLGAMVDDLQPIMGFRIQQKEAELKLLTPDDKRGRARVLNSGTSFAEQSLATTVKDHHLDDLIRYSLDQIRNQELRTIVVKIAAMIAVGVVASIGAGVVAAAVEGALLADVATASVSASRAIRGAQIAGELSGIATDSAINAVGGWAINGDGVGEGFASNVATNAILHVALAPLHKGLGAFRATEKELENISRYEKVLRGAKLTLYTGVELTTDMLTAAAVDYAIHRIRHGGQAPDPKTMIDWMVQGASMGIGAFVGKRLHGVQERLVLLAGQGAQLYRRTQRLKAFAERLATRGTREEALDVLVEYHSILRREAEQINELQGSRKPPDEKTRAVLAKIAAGNAAEQRGIQLRIDTPFELANLRKEDAGGRNWIGSTEEIAVALHSAHLMNFEVKVLDHDVHSREWRVSVGGEEIKILETRLRGQPRASNRNPTEQQRASARRYAAAADYLQDEWERKTTIDVDAKLASQKFFEVDHLQLGHSISGVISQATIPAHGEAIDARLIIYSHEGTLAGRGAQELGQSPSKWDAPGLRSSEQARSSDQAWITSDEHKRSLEVGRLEVQTAAYRGEVTRVEARGREVPQDWEAPGRRFRVEVHSASGKHWFYCDRFDNAGGLGPGSMSEAARVVPNGQLDALVADGRMLRGDDPEFARKLSPGKVFVWGGTPSGAWAAEAAHAANSETVTIAGDTRERRDWPTLLAEYASITEQLAAVRDHGTSAAADPTIAERLSARKSELEKLINDAHNGARIPRNRKPGAPYEKPPTAPRAAGDVQLEFGSPTRVEPAPGGGVAVTINGQTRIFDQVIVATGPDPSAAGGPGALLGRGATQEAVETPRGQRSRRVYGEVPEGTIALKPIYGPHADGVAPDVIGLESIDPPGLRLVGAAYASEKMSPWVARPERAGFEAAVARMAERNAPTRDHGPISEHSTTVSPGIEVQRDRVPRANEVLGAQVYHLSKNSQDKATLTAATPEQLDEQVRLFFAMELRAADKWVRVERFGGGKSRAVVYRVWVGDNELGVFKLFPRLAEAQAETKMLALLKAAHLTKMTAVRERGSIEVTGNDQFHGAALMDTAKGTSVKQLVEQMPADPAARAAELRKLESAVRRVAEGLAEMHRTFGANDAHGDPVLMTEESKLSDATYFLDKSFRGDNEGVAGVKVALGADYERVRAKVEAVVLPEFLAAKVPATAYHGDANAGNFIVDGYDLKSRQYTELGVIDVGSMAYSVDAHGKGTKTGAADVARFLGSLDTLHPGALTAAEISRLRQAFLRDYFREYTVGTSKRPVNIVDYDKAETWYRLEMEIAISRSDARAKSRILQLLQLEATP